MSRNHPILGEFSPEGDTVHCIISAQVDRSSWAMGAQSEDMTKTLVSRRGFFKKGMPLPWVTGKPVWADFLKLG